MGLELNQTNFLDQSTPRSKILIRSVSLASQKLVLLELLKQLTIEFTLYILNHARVKRQV